jgi:hypothetical protein
MKSLMIAATGMALALSTSVGAAAGSNAGPKPVPAVFPPPTPIPVAPGKSSPVAGPTVLPGPIILKNGVVQSSLGGNTLSAGFNNLDSLQRLNCKSSCTILVSAMVQLSTAGNWAICAVVDGKNINPPCPYQGSLPDTGSYVTGNSQQSWTVAAGSHTVQTQVFVTSANAFPTTLGNWQTTRLITNGQTINAP